MTAAITLQTALPRFLVGGAAAFDLVLVVVVYVALTRGPVAGIVAGSVAGIIQDALSSGVIGIGGLAKSAVGFAAGTIGQQFIMAEALPRLVMFVGATAAHSAVFMGMYVLIGIRSFPSPWTAILGQALGNAAVGMMAFTIVESLPGIMERRRLSKRTRH